MYVLEYAGPSVLLFHREVFQAPVAELLVYDVCANISDDPTALTAAPIKTCRKVRRNLIKRFELDLGDLDDESDVMVEPPWVVLLNKFRKLRVRIGQSSLKNNLV